MNDIVPFLIVGVTTGAVYGLAGVGLVLTYKTSGIFNFAHGALATVAAYTFYELWVTAGLPWGVALALTLVGLSSVLRVGFGAFRGAALAGASGAAGRGHRGADSGGRELLLPHLRTDCAAVPASSFLTETFRVGGVNVGYDKVIIFGISIAVTGALYLLFRTTQLGRQMQAVVDDSRLLDLTGASSHVRSPVGLGGGLLLGGAVRDAARSLGGSRSCDADASHRPSVRCGRDRRILQSAADLGGRACDRGGGVVGHKVRQLHLHLGRASAEHPVLGPVRRDPVPASGPGQPGLQHRRHSPCRPNAGGPLGGCRAAGGRYSAGRSWSWSRPGTRVHLGGMDVGADQRGVTVVPGAVGASVGPGVAVPGELRRDRCGRLLHIWPDRVCPGFIALLVAGLIVVPLGALLAVPAIRLSGLYLALATFGFGLLLQDMFYQSHFMFGPTNVGIILPRPSFASNDRPSTTWYWRLRS